jgi:phosphatidylglycerol:prolipoprotein diacylglycerol transferase
MSYYVHNIDPALIHFGAIQIRYYGLMYLTGFILCYYLLKYRRKNGLFGLEPIQVQDLYTYIMVAMMVGARTFYVFVYNWDSYKNNPIQALYIWQGGLSFHGAAVGFIIAMILFSRKHKIGFWHLADHVATGSALGIFLGRIGNFTNGELWGRPTTVPWAVIFPQADMQPRHPSQLYQALAEGLLVFLLLVWIDSRERKKYLVKVEKKGKTEVTWKRSGILASCFLIFYGTGRFMMEFFREPDAQLGYYFGYFSMGQILCFLMILPGIYLLLMNLRTWKEEHYVVQNSVK